MKSGLDGFGLVAEAPMHRYTAQELLINSLSLWINVRYISSAVFISVLVATMPPPFDKPGISSALLAADESTPLLSHVEPIPLPDPVDSSLQHQHSIESEEESDDEDDEKPLPKAQIIFLCYNSFITPVAFFSIFPYINFMIEKVVQVEKEDVGFYSGLIESLFGVTQMCVMILWGKVRI